MGKGRRGKARGRVERGEERVIGVGGRVGRGVGRRLEGRGRRRGKGEEGVNGKRGEDRRERVGWGKHDNPAGDEPSVPVVLFFVCCSSHPFHLC